FARREITLVRVIHVGHAGADRIEGLERTDELTGRKDFDINAPGAGVSNALREPDRTSLQTRHVSGPVGHHSELATALCDRRRRETRGYRGRQNSCAAQDIASPHGCPSQGDMLPSRRQSVTPKAL